MKVTKTVETLYCDICQREGPAPVLALKEAKAMAENFNSRLKTRSEVLAESEKQFDAIMAELREAAV